MAALVMPVAAATAATQWNLSGSLRYTTFWSERNAGKYGTNDLQGGGASLRRDGLLDWSTQANSRVRMFMRSDALEGYIEMGFNYGGNKVTAREYWGRYNFGDKAFIIIGHQKQLFNQYFAGQVWDGELGMGGIGTVYQSAKPKIVAGYGGLRLALSKPYNGRSVADNHGLTVDALGRKDIDTYLPQLQAAYEYTADSWRVKLAGAYQHMRLKRIAGLTFNNKDINSWLLAAEGDINFGPLYLAAGVSAGQNWSDAGWNDETSNIDGYYTKDYFTQYGGFAVSTGGGLKSTTSMMLSVVAAYRLTETLRFEAGTGYRYDRNDAFKRNGHVWTAYLQATYAIAPGFTVTPEIGYIDLGRHVMQKNDMGYIWYVGAKWQMDF